MDEAKPCACDTWQGLCVWCCGVSMFLVCQLEAIFIIARAEVVWDDLP